MILLLSFALHVLCQVILVIQLEGLFHAGVDNKLRATSVSLISLADSAIVALLALLIGFVADQIGFAAAISCSLLLYGGIGVLGFFQKAPSTCSALEEKECEETL